ncbi:GreA/GreB family elongation factor [Limobrevibacterium gyesilva]|uniref:GreA/GreB family elongation factor n=1 Tax=Limobrevibacterium gyesilva TaxID=2991712 RepID=A0AA41YMK8_9PROT|nr:GreA/GreB family elongation factor [Limobrevibacterium gyesilva]MCW3475286.1 GreA/GreB family elongation factor [Limobrevibacterium gyesilva]
MSRAFVSEEAAETRAAALPERPISDHPNLVTPRGLQLIEAHVAGLQDSLANAVADDAERPKLARDLRYWQARKASARVVEPPPGPPQEVTFGTTVAIRRRDGSIGRYRIVGEDEADPAKGLLSWVSPLAEALIGAQAGDVVEVGGGRPAVTVEAIARE